MIALDELKRSSPEDLEAHRAWVKRNGGPTLPLDLHEGGVTLMVIRAEIRDAMTNSSAFAQVRREPPALLRWALRPWLLFRVR